MPRTFASMRCKATFQRGQSHPKRMTPSSQLVSHAESTVRSGSGVMGLPLALTIAGNRNAVVRLWSAASCV